MPSVERSCNKDEEDQALIRSSSSSSSSSSLDKPGKKNVVNKFNS